MTQLHTIIPPPTSIRNENSSQPSKLITSCPQRTCVVATSVRGDLAPAGADLFGAGRAGRADLADGDRRNEVAERRSPGECQPGGHGAGDAGTRTVAGP